LEPSSVISGDQGRFRARLRIGLMAHRQNEKHVNREIGDPFQALERNLDPAAIEQKPSTKPHHTNNRPCHSKSAPPFPSILETEGEDIAGECDRTALPARNVPCRLAISRSLPSMAGVWPQQKPHR
jgi:hypothetical protein